MPYKDPAKQREARRKYEAEKRKSRYRVWMLIFYPDSAPEDWRDEIADLHLPTWVSPLHDSDVWTKADEKKNPKHKAGQTKKPHYHLVAEYPNPVSAADFLEDFSFLKGPTDVKRARDKTAMLRYLIHLDNPEKAQYRSSDLSVFSGAEIADCFKLGEAQRHKELKAMRRFVSDNGFTSFAEFHLWCDEHNDIWSNLLDNTSTYVMTMFIQSVKEDIMNGPRTQTEKMKLLCKAAKKDPEEK